MAPYDEPRGGKSVTTVILASMGQQSDVCSNNAVNLDAIASTNSDESCQV